MASLRVMTGPAAGRTISITDEIVIGRENAELSIGDDELSRRHAVVRRRDRGLEVEDLGSANGTFVDGVRIVTATIVSGGAKLRFGTTEMVVEGVLPAQGTKIHSEIAGPQMTRISAPAPPVVAEPEPAPVVAEPDATPIADPQATVARAVPTDLTRAGPVQPVSDETRARPIPSPSQPTQARPIPSPSQPTQARPIPSPSQPTQARPIPSPSQPTQARPTAPPPPPPAAPASPVPVGTFSPPAHRRGTGLASRSKVPVVLSFGTLIVVAIALVIYFASR